MPVARIFLWEGVIQRGDAPNEAGGGLGCLRLHFERFEKLALSKLLFFKSNFVFSNRVLYLTIV